jgi:hypothetical protein
MLSQKELAGKYGLVLPEGARLSVPELACLASQGPPEEDLWAAMVGGYDSYQWRSLIVSRGVIGRDDFIVNEVLGSVLGRVSISVRYRYQNRFAASCVPAREMAVAEAARTRKAAKRRRA